MDRMNGFGDVLQGLVEQMAANAEAIEANRDELMVIRQAVADNSRMLAAIMDHLQAPKKRSRLLKTG